MEFLLNSLLELYQTRHLCVYFALVMEWHDLLNFRKVLLSIFSGAYEVILVNETDKVRKPS